VPQDFDFDEQLYTQVIYEAGRPGTLAGLYYYHGRLTKIRIQATDERVLLPAITRWGEGTITAEDGWRGIERRWDGTAGWQATLTTKPKPDDHIAPSFKVTDLTFVLGGAAAADPEVTHRGFAQIAPLIGSPLESAERVFPGLRRETADSDESAPELGDARQGFATIVVPWSPWTWELVLSPEPKSSKIRTAVLTGSTDDEANRVALFSALRRAFGEPRPIISEAGRLEIEFLSPRVRVRCAETENQWVITVNRR
jgi:hypothetical protein